MSPSAHHTVLAMSYNGSLSKRAQPSNRAGQSRGDSEGQSPKIHTMAENSLFISISGPSGKGRDGGSQNPDRHPQHPIHSPTTHTAVLYAITLLFLSKNFTHTNIHSPISLSYHFQNMNSIRLGALPVHSPESEKLITQQTLNKYLLNELMSSSCFSFK